MVKKENKSENRHQWRWAEKRGWLQIWGRIIPSKAQIGSAMFLLKKSYSLLCFGYLVVYTFLSLALQNLPATHAPTTNTCYSSTKNAAEVRLPVWPFQVWDVFTWSGICIHYCHCLESFPLLYSADWFGHLSISCMIIKFCLIISQMQFASSSEFPYPFVDTVGIDHLTDCFRFPELL